MSLTTLVLSIRKRERARKIQNEIPQNSQMNILKPTSFVGASSDSLWKNICIKTRKIVRKWDKIARNCFNCLCILMKIRFCVSVTVLCEILSQNPLLLINFFESNLMDTYSHADKKYYFSEFKEKCERN